MQRLRRTIKATRDARVPASLKQAAVVLAEAKKAMQRAQDLHGVIARNPQHYGEARYLEHPTTLTDDDIGQLALVSAGLAERSRARRAGYVERDSEDLKKIGKQPVTISFLLKHFRDCVGPIIGTHRLRIREAHERIAALEARIAELESQPGGFCYRGVWKEGEVYNREVGVTHAGSMWIAKAVTTERPGTDEGAAFWVLAVKRGTDGRDGKDAGR